MSEHKFVGDGALRPSSSASIMETSNSELTITCMGATTMSGHEYEIKKTLHLPKEFSCIDIALFESGNRVIASLCKFCQDGRFGEVARGYGCKPDGDEDLAYIQASIDALKQLYVALGGSDAADEKTETED